MNDRRDKVRLAKGVGDEAATARRDENLIRGVLAGDAGAVGRLIQEYDRLVRYAIFQGFGSACGRDPSFLDARASEVWTGFVQSVRRRGAGPEGSLQAYLTRIARNKCLDHLRREGREPEGLAGDGGDALDVERLAGAESDPVAALIGLEQVEALRSCIAELPLDDRKLLQEIELLTQTRWSEAAGRLGMAESTLRSRWAKVTGRLRRCVEKKLPDDPESFAPPGR